MIIKREWAMPDKWTFKIKPIARLIAEYVGDGLNWIDPFAGLNSPAEITNDLNPERPTKFHLHAKDFANELRGGYSGVLFDPPYSNRQTKECYESIGLNFNHQNSKESVHFGNVKDILKDKIKLGGIAISFGWNTTGFGKKRGFEIVKILIVNHGGNGHHDTLCTVERKFTNNLI